MKKPRKSTFIVSSFVVLAVIALLWSLLWNVHFYGDSLDIVGGEVVGTNFGAFHIVFNVLFIAAWLVFFGTLLGESIDDIKMYKRFYTTDKSESKSLHFDKKWINWGIIILILFVVFGWGRVIFKQTASMFNKSKLYHNYYTQKVQEKAGFYDKLWKTYLQKEKITNINRETFILVTKYIMENRRDGEKLSWKWLQENQPIPYDDFTKFYVDLSNFISSQREGYFDIEKECQLIANQNNTLLDIKLLKST
jgi:hypothetical protein